MNPLDIGVIAVIGLSAVFAFARGFVREALSIVAWIGAGFITLYGFGAVYAMVDPMVHNPLLSQLIAVGGTFLVSLIVLTVFTSMVARRVRSSGLSSIDRTLGFIFGLARGLLLVSLAYLFVENVMQANDRPPWLKEAKSAPYLHEGAEMLRTVLPESLKMKSTATTEELFHALTPTQEVWRAIHAPETPSAPPAATPASTPQPTYRQTDQHNLDRLFGNQH
jgi:membrane protein required for colicin V production